MGPADQPVLPRRRGAVVVVRRRSQPGQPLPRGDRRPHRRARRARADRPGRRRPHPALPEGGLGMTSTRAGTTPGTTTSGALTAPTGAPTTIELRQVSRWYGNVVAVNDVTMTIGPGVTGLLGPNGAGKSTLIALMSGFLAPSTGTVTLDGEPLWRNESVYRQIGLVPEREALFDYLTGRQFVVA